jgi:hypothetical protein
VYALRIPPLCLFVSAHAVSVCILLISAPYDARHESTAKMSFMFRLVFGPVVFGVLTAVIMKSAVFRDVTPCRALKVN